MKEIKNWNGHRVLVLPRVYHAVSTVMQLLDELGHDTRRNGCCGLCPAWDATKPDWKRCTNPSRHQPSTQGGCFGRIIVAEEYIPLVQIRLGEPT